MPFYSHAQCKHFNCSTSVDITNNNNINTEMNCVNYRYNTDFAVDWRLFDVNTVGYEKGLYI